MLILRKNFFLFCTPTWKLDNPYCHCHWPSNSMKEHKDKQLYCWTGILNLTGTKNYTPAKTHFKWTKISSLEIDVFWLKNGSEKWSRILYFEIQRAPSELLLHSAKKISAHKGWIGLADQHVSLKGLAEFQNKKIQTPFQCHY